MADRKITCNIISPERPLFQGQAEYVVVTTREGELAVYPLHAPLVALLGVGEVRVVLEGGGMERFGIRGGFVQVSGDVLNVLVTNAVKAEEIQNKDLEAEEADIKAAKPHSDAEFDGLYERRRWLGVRRRLTVKSR